MQYPGPTLIVHQGDTVTVTLAQRAAGAGLDRLPGPAGRRRDGRRAGALTREAPAGAAGAPGGPVTYTFVAVAAGHVPVPQRHATRRCRWRWGSLGALIVRPAGVATRCARPTPSPAPRSTASTCSCSPRWTRPIHARSTTTWRRGGSISVDTTASTVPTLWFINGRNAPDTMLDAGVPWLPTQPYSCLPRMHPGEKLLMRVVDARARPAPLPPHGNHALRHRPRRPGARERIRRTHAPPDLATLGLHRQLGPGRDGGRDLRVDRQGARLGHLRPRARRPRSRRTSTRRITASRSRWSLPDLLGPDASARYYSGSPVPRRTSATLPPGAPVLNPNAGLLPHVALAQREGESTNERHLPGRHDDDARHRAAVRPHPLRAEARS